MAPSGNQCDHNVLSVVTGSPEHDGYALDFVEAIAEVEAKIPGVFAGATLAPREQVQQRTVCGASQERNRRRYERHEI